MPRSVSSSSDAAVRGPETGQCADTGTRGRRHSGPSCDLSSPLQVSVLTVMPCRLLPLVLALAQAVHRAEGDVPRCEGGHTGPRPFCFPADYNKVGVAARMLLKVEICSKGTSLYFQALKSKHCGKLQSIKSPPRLKQPMLHASKHLPRGFREVVPYFHPNVSILHCTGYGDMTMTSASCHCQLNTW